MAPNIPRWTFSRCGRRTLHMPRSEADVSVLVPTYNRGHFIAESLDSILGQTRPPIQVIVINDGSTDCTHSAIKPYLGRIEYLEKANGGRSTAINLGMAKVRGHYVWIMDDDDVALPDALERHLAVLEQHPEFGFTYSNYILAGTGADGRILPAEEKPMSDIPEPERLICMMEQPFLASPSMLVRRSCYQAVGEFDPKLVRCQDYDMNLRLLRQYRSFRVNVPTFYRRLHDGVRGSGADSFPSTEMVRKWQMYGQQIFRRLRRDLPLSEYLPKMPREEPSLVFDTRRAYLQRMVIMASKDLFEEMWEDLALALADPNHTQPLSREERIMIWSTVNYLLRHDNSNFSAPPFLGCIKRLCKGANDRKIQTHLARVIGGQAIRAFKETKYTAALNLMSACFQLLSMTVPSPRQFLQQKD